MSRLSREITGLERQLIKLARREARRYDHLANKPKYTYENPATWERDDKPWWSCGHRVVDSNNPHAKRWVMLCETCDKCTRTPSEAARYARMIIDKLAALRS